VLLFINEFVYDSHPQKLTTTLYDCYCVNQTFSFHIVHSAYHLKKQLTVVGMFSTYVNRICLNDSTVFRSIENIVDMKMLGT
jgi:hypothetical protein